jgi:Tfp pilus assembly protein PilV
MNRRLLICTLFLLVGMLGFAGTTAAAAQNADDITVDADVAIADSVAHSRAATTPDQISLQQ